MGGVDCQLPPTMPFKIPYGLCTMDDKNLIAQYQKDGY